MQEEAIQAFIKELSEKCMLCDTYAETCRCAVDIFYPFVKASACSLWIFDEDKDLMRCEAVAGTVFSAGDIVSRNVLQQERLAFETKTPTLLHDAHKLVSNTPHLQQCQSLICTFSTNTQDLGGAIHFFFPQQFAFEPLTYYGVLAEGVGGSVLQCEQIHTEIARAKRIVASVIRMLP